MEIAQGMTILIIDDKSSNIYAIETLLEKPDRVFRSATNGKEGLKIALNEPVDLIILDVQMPEMDGFEVAQVLQSHKRTKEIPIIFASAEKKEKHSIMKGFEEGAVDYLSKPLDPELTRAKVAVLLKIQSQRKELQAKNLSLERADLQIKLLNEDLRKNVAQLEIVNKDLEAFSYNVSHDLRAPLRAIMGYSGALMEDYGHTFDGNAKRTLDIVIQNAHRMNALIDDLLAFSKLGRQEVKKSEVHTQLLVENVISDISKNVEHKVSFKIESLPSAHADFALLNHVWTNLISNAIKYSSKKDEPVVSIGSKKTEGEVIFFIQDNGAGFNMEYADKLFKVFQRLHSTAEFEGTGVGLALVNRIIEKHNGKIWAEGSINQGATFYFSLPVNN